jgi:hypothetical protein
MNVEACAPLGGRHPDFKGCLSPNAMILESGEQTNYPTLHPLTGNGETVMLGELGINISLFCHSRRGKMNESLIFMRS